MDKVVLILGATSDIGRCVANVYAGKGYSVWLAGRNSELISSIKSDVEIRFKVKTEQFVFDAEKTDEHMHFFSNLPSIPDEVVWAIGYLGQQEVSENDWNEASRTIQANYTGAVSILSIVANSFEERKSGTIIGISSVAGERGRMSNYIYGSAKAGLTAFLSGMRNRLFHSGVHVLSVQPGFVDTKMVKDISTPGPLTASPEKVANRIYNAARRKKNTTYVLGIWRLIMFIIRNLPEFLFKRLKL